jgi:hypothetical protein
MAAYRRPLDLFSCGVARLSSDSNEMLGLGATDFADGVRY